MSSQREYGECEYGEKERQVPSLWRLTRFVAERRVSTCHIRIPPIERNENEKKWFCHGNAAEAKWEVMPAVGFDKEAEPNARDYCVAKNATQRAARPGPSLRKERLFRMTIKLRHCLS
ncbi:MAG: hypothetical protein WBQ87_00905, partial [Candidatus Sulfotelmatobacter sp.]